MAAADPRIRAGGRSGTHLVARAEARPTKRSSALCLRPTELALGLPPSREASCQSAVDHNVLAVEPANLAFRHNDDRLSDAVWLAQTADRRDVALHHVSAGHLLEVRKYRRLDRTGSNVVDANTAGEPTTRKLHSVENDRLLGEGISVGALDLPPGEASSKIRSREQLGQSAAPLPPVVCGDAGDIDDPAVVSDSIPQGSVRCRKPSRLTHIVFSAPTVPGKPAILSRAEMGSAIRERAASIEAGSDRSQLVCEATLAVGVLTSRESTRCPRSISRTAVA